MNVFSAALIFAMANAKAISNNQGTFLEKTNCENNFDKKLFIEADQILEEFFKELEMFDDHSYEYEPKLTLPHLFR